MYPLCLNKAGGVEGDALKIGSLQIFVDTIYTFAFLNCHSYNEKLTSNVPVLFISMPSKNKNMGVMGYSKHLMSLTLFIRYSDFTFAVGVKLLNSKYIRLCLENQGFQRRY